NPDLFGDQPALPFDGDNTMPNRPVSDYTVQHSPSQYGQEARPQPRPSAQNTLTSSQSPSQSPSASTMPSSRSASTQPPQAAPSARPTMPQQTQPMSANTNNQRTAAGAYQQGYAPPNPPAPPPGQRTRAGQDPALPRRKPTRKKILGFPAGCVTVFLALFASFCGGLTLITVVAVVAAGTRVEQLVQERIALVDDYQNFESTFFYDRNGQVLYETFGEGRRTNVDYANFPQDLINATVAIEDDTFFSNPGVEVEATGRAFLQYTGLIEGSSGGSTITQQVVRNVLFDFAYRAERSVTRKLEEILLALALKQRKTNEEILELYLNEIYYGSLAYGAEAASQVFFNKHVNELSLGEAALLAGLPQFPAEYNPLDPDPEVQAAVSLRWRTVLDRMVEEGYITDAQRDETLRQGLTFSSADVPLNAPHFTVYAQTEVERLMGELGYSPEDVARGGLRIFTTVDLRINQMAQQAARDQIARLSANQVSNAAVLVMTPLTGEILAMVGSVDYDNDDIDGRVNVTISLRQPGSTMKPFTYSAAIEAGMTAGD
ncbi:MAG: transglycosylase domain-containing protein, partial [Burkholderiales bacterium]|nr:transglycosylase domain-containing protein [Anaerolineae bacterium]